MESTAGAMGNPGRSRPRDRVAAGFLIAVMVVGSPVLWIGVPVASSWVGGRLTADATTHLQIVVPLTIAGMVLFARLLFWVNKLYLRIAARAAEHDWEDEPEETGPRYARGPLEPILVASLVIAFVALSVWFFVFAENPSHQVF
jgi:hypothetical protein